MMVVAKAMLRVRLAVQASLMMIVKWL